MSYRVAMTTKLLSHWNQTLRILISCLAIATLISLVYQGSQIVAGQANQMCANQGAYLQVCPPRMDISDILRAMTQ